MLLAAFEPGKEMAIANFFLAIFFLFTIALPLLLITRGDKTQANRDFISATVNPWSQVSKKIELTPVVLSGIPPSIELQPELEIYSENHHQSISESGVVISRENIVSDEMEDSSDQVVAIDDQVLAA